MSDNRNDQLRVRLEDGRLVISIGISLLCYATANGIDLGDDVKITDEDKFALAICQELERDEEDGTTLLHVAFDRAGQEAIESGCDGILLSDEDGDEP